MRPHIIPFMSSNQNHLFNALESFITDPGPLTDDPDEHLDKELEYPHRPSCPSSIPSTTLTPHRSGFNHLPPKQQITLLCQAYAQHNAAAERKVRALSAARERLRAECERLDERMSNLTVVANHFRQIEAGDRRNALVRVLVERSRLEEEAAELEGEEVE